MSDMINEWRSRIFDAMESGRPLRLRGSGSKDFYGQQLVGDVLDTRGHAGVVAYEPTELVVTARCGTPLAELEATLAGQGQGLAFEPPHFGPAATVGGMVAAGLSGPRRAQAGALRDFVLGAKIVDGKGEVLAFGGQVMKNVAGYDVARLMAGSLGTLGLIAEVSLKVLPFPVARATLAFPLTQECALARLNEWGGQPLPIAASAWYDGVLRVRLSGAAAAVAAAADRLGREAGGAVLDDAEADAYWQGLREQTLVFFAGDEPLWRLSVASTTPPLGLPGATLIEWGGAQRWLRGERDAACMRDLAARSGGHATLFRGGDKTLGVFQPLPAALLKIHRRIKGAFDPHGVFNRGRLYEEF